MEPETKNRRTRPKRFGKVTSDYLRKLIKTSQLKEHFTSEEKGSKLFLNFIYIIFICRRVYINLNIYKITFAQCLTTRKRIRFYSSIWTGRPRPFARLCGCFCTRRHWKGFSLIRIGSIVSFFSLKNFICNLFFHNFESNMILFIAVGSWRALQYTSLWKPFRFSNKLCFQGIYI